MVYNDLVFIHIPKTGGSSIRSSLSKNYDLLYNATKQNLIKLGYSNLENFENYNFSVHDFKDHLPYQLIKKNSLEKNKFSFTFIRNPFSRMVSLYYECINNPLIVLDVNKDNSFEYFVNLVTEKSYWFTIPMIDYIGIDNTDKIDFIGRFENFENDILRLKKKIKISIKHHNFNNHIKNKLKFSDYTKFYKSNKLIDMVEKYYDKDLNKFKYDFDQFINFEKKKIKLITIFSKMLKKKMINLI
jgi:hypothetical protein